MKRLMCLLFVLGLMSCAATRADKRDGVGDLAAAKLALKLEPENPANYIALGNLLVEDKQYDQAQAAYDSATQLAPGNTLVLVQKGVLNWRKGDQAAAVEIFKSVLSGKDAAPFAAKIGAEIGMPFERLKLTTGKGEYAFPSVSAGTPLLLCQSNRDGNWEIYALDVDTQQITRLTNHPARDEAPALSADGGQFVFTSTRDDTVHKHVEETVRQLYTGQIAGGQVARLSRTAADHWSPRYSADGKKILYISEGEPAAADAANAIYEMDLATGQATLLTPALCKYALGGYDASGKTLFYSCDLGGQFEVYQMQQKTGKPGKIFGQGRSVFGVQPSPDGRKLVFSALNADQYDLFLLDLGSGQIQQLTCASGADAHPVFSPDGRKIYFQSNREGPYHIYALLLDSPAPVEQVLDALQKLNVSSDLARI